LEHDAATSAIAAAAKIDLFIVFIVSF